MIIVIRIYEVHSVDSQALIHSFDEDGLWQRISVCLAGHVHIDLLQRSDLPTVFLVQEFWESERHFALAERNTEVRSFLQHLRTLAVSHQSSGVFCFRNAWESESNGAASFRVPTVFPRHEVRQ